MIPLELVAPVPLDVAPVLVSVGWVPWPTDDRVLPPGDRLVPVVRLAPVYSPPAGVEEFPALYGLLALLLVGGVVPLPADAALLGPLALVVVPARSLAAGVGAASFEGACVLVLECAAVVREGGRVAAFVVSLLRVA